MVGLGSVCAKFQLPSLSRSGLEVPGGGVWCGVVVWLRPILVFSLSLSQAEQYGSKELVTHQVPQMLAKPENNLSKVNFIRDELVLPYKRKTGLDILV